MSRWFRVFIWFLISFTVTTFFGIGFAWYKLEQAVVIGDSQNMEAEWKKKE